MAVETPPAPLLVPLLALVVALSVDSIKEDDPIEYRFFVGSLGIAAIGPISIVLFLSVLSGNTESAQSTILIHSIISITTVIVLLIGTMIFEVSRGLEGLNLVKFMAIISVIAVIWYGGMFLLL